MKLEQIRESYAVEYNKCCECCGLNQKILTQGGNYPEYETEVYLQCQCGDYIEFVLPVN